VSELIGDVAREAGYGEGEGGERMSEGIGFLGEGAAESILDTEQER
jgi:hypothetical protein